MVKKVELIKYLPEFLRGYKEFIELFKVGDKELQRLIDETEPIKNLSFVLFCDEVGIKRYEDILKIPTNLADGLEARRNRVLIRINDSLPYTYRELLNQLRSLCGDDFTVVLLNDIYTLKIDVNLPLAGQVDEFDRMLRKLIPANLVVVKTNKLARVEKAGLKVASAIAQNKTIYIDSTINVERTIGGMVYSGTAVSKNQVYKIKE